MKSKGKNKAMVAPLLPLTFILGYQYDLAYGEKMERMRSKYNLNKSHITVYLVKLHHSKKILDKQHFHRNLKLFKFGLLFHITLTM